MLLPNSKDRNKVCPETTKIEITNKLSYSMLNKLEPVTVVAWVNINTSIQDVTRGLHSAPAIAIAVTAIISTDTTRVGISRLSSERCLCRKADCNHKGEEISVTLYAIPCPYDNMHNLWG